MYRYQRSPLLLLVALLALSALACQAISFGQPKPAADTVAPAAEQQQIIDQAVATVMARIGSPAPTPIAAAPIIHTDLEGALTALYEHVNPSVVLIYVLDRQGLPMGSGSGFVYDAQGHIVTNNHVVSTSDGLEVVFADGQRRSAIVVGTDIDSDLAVIRVDSLPDGAPPATLGNSNDVRVGQFVAAIGSPFGETGSLSLGIVSGLGRSLTSDRIAEGGGRYSLPSVIQTDAAINPGNSGGPLLNLDGRIIGINSAISTSTGANSGVGFSIPVNAVHRVVPSLIAEGVYHYPFMGIKMTTLDLSAQQAMGLPQVTGAYVTDLTPNGPAAAAGLRASGFNDSVGTIPGGDLIIAIDGRPVANPDDLIDYLVFETEVGQTVSLSIIRDGAPMELPLTLGERP